MNQRTNIVKCDACGWQGVLISKTISQEICPHCSMQGSLQYIPVIRSYDNRGANGKGNSQ